MSAGIASDAAPERAPSRFVVGIDLGTTNCAVGYVDTNETAWKVRTFRVPQLVAAGQVEPRDTLPSFHYQPAAGEFSAESVRLPWHSNTGHSGSGAAAGQSVEKRAVEKRDSPSRQYRIGAEKSPVGKGQSPFSAGEQPGCSIVGSFARDHGVLSQGRLIESAKSWLCHAGVDRTAELLPWHGLPEVERVSPVEASSRYLKHIHDAWNHQFPESPLAQQDVIVTLPASFDEVARELTVKAAALAGLPRIVLIEEPQAAFYAWINRHRDNWERLVSPGQKILVCDIGGGTSDFTLIRVRARDDGKVQFHRVAVGEHLILGGDNLDLALAHALETKLVGDRQLEPRQWGVLVRVCRQAKETLLGENPPEKLTVHLPSRGSRLIGGGMQVAVTRAEVESLLVSGFLPEANLDDRPNRHRSGFQEFGLPYAADPAITHYLADFLSTHRHIGEEVQVAAKGWHAQSGATGVDAGEHALPAGQGVPHGADHARPDIILFNGGFFASPVLRERLLEVLKGWFPSKSKKTWSPIVLDHDRLDLAVAHGAAYYGMVRRGAGVKIAAGLARTYYIGVEGAAPQAVCLIAAGTEPGQHVDLEDPTFELLVSQPVEFPLNVSSTRLTDLPGTVVPFDREQMTPLPPIRTVIRSSSKGETGRVPIQLHARLTEIGTLDLWCSSLDQNRRWKLQFDVRSTTQSDVAPHSGAGEREGFVDETVWERCYELIGRTFGPQGTNDPESLIKRLAEAIGSDRRDWPASLLRRLWEALIEVEAGRTRTAMHEARWLNLAGFSLRPGYGLAADDWRVTETRRMLLNKPGHSTPACLSERWILWRRICGGMPSGQQRALADTVLPQLRDMARLRDMAARPVSKHTFGAQASSHKSAEMWRLLGALELLPVQTKIAVGEMIVQALVAGRLAPVRPALCWTLGRLGARQPSYGPLNMVVPADILSGWLDQLAAVDDSASVFQLALMQLARRTGDRYRDISESTRGTVLKAMQDHHAPAHFITLVRVGGLLDTEEENLIFGEALPKGLRIR